MCQKVIHTYYKSDLQYVFYSPKRFYICQLDAREVSLPLRTVRISNIHNIKTTELIKQKLNLNKTTVKAFKSVFKSGSDLKWDTSNVSVSISVVSLLIFNSDS